MTPRIITPSANGVRIRILVQPGASKTALAGRHGDALRVRIATPPVDGKANEALIRFLAASLGLPRRAVVIASGEASRRKLVDVDGVNVAAAMTCLLGEGSKA